MSEKAGMVGPLELNVVNRPFSWRAVSSMLISVPELTQLFVSCGDIRTVCALEPQNRPYITATWKGRAVSDEWHWLVGVV